MAMQRSSSSSSSIRLSVPQSLLLFIAFIIAALPIMSAHRPLRDESGSESKQAQVTIPVQTNTTPQVPRNRSKELSMMAGSALPDCSHACGPCTPCRRVTVSYMCLTSRDSEACPSTYRCMCHGKSFPVP